MPTAMDAIYVAIDSAYRSGDKDLARSRFEKLLPVLAFTNQHIDVSIRFFKMLRHDEGIFTSDFCRPPVRILDSFQDKEARRLIRYTKALQSDISAAMSDMAEQSAIDDK